MIVVDTHAWIWWLDQREALSGAAFDAMKDGGMLLSPMTFWEVAMLAEKRRITLTRPVRDWLDYAVTTTRATIVPITIDVAVRAAALPDPIRDPADRLIVATALDRRVPLVTKDERIHRAGAVASIW